MVNGAQGFYKHQFGIGGDNLRETWLLGLTNGAPYFFCAGVGCCKCPYCVKDIFVLANGTGLTHPMNKRLGRRGTIFVAQVSMLASSWPRTPTKSLC